MPSGVKGSSPKCSIFDCEVPVYGRGWCENHYARWRRTGSPSGVGRGRRTVSKVDKTWLLEPPPDRVRISAEVRFWHKVTSETEPSNPKLGHCWIWQGAKDQDGYGVFYFSRNGKRFYRAHHFLAGKALAGLEWDHLCLNKACVRPQHLEAVTGLENTRRARAGLTHTLPERKP